MPGLIGISEFVDETIDDYNSPTTSTFVAKMPQCRQTISGLEEVSQSVFFIPLFLQFWFRYFNSSLECVCIFALR